MNACLRLNNIFVISDQEDNSKVLKVSCLDLVVSLEVKGLDQVGQAVASGHEALFGDLLASLYVGAWKSGMWLDTVVNEVLDDSEGLTLPLGWVQVVDVVERGDWILSHHLIDTVIKAGETRVGEGNMRVFWPSKDHSIPGTVEIAATTVLLNLELVATTVSIGMIGVDLGRGVHWLMLVTNVVDKVSQGNRVVIIFVFTSWKVGLMNLLNVIIVFSTSFVSEPINKSVESVSDVF